MIPGALDSIGIELELRGPLAAALIYEARRNNEEPVTLLARSVDRMIERGLLDTIDNSRPPRVLDIKDFRLAALLTEVQQHTGD